MEPFVPRKNKVILSLSLKVKRISFLNFEIKLEKSNSINYFLHDLFKKAKLK